MLATMSWASVASVQPADKNGSSRAVVQAQPQQLTQDGRQSAGGHGELQVSTRDPLLEEEREGIELRTPPACVEPRPTLRPQRWSRVDREESGMGWDGDG